MSCLVVHLSVCPSEFISTIPTGRIIVKFHIRNFYKNLSRNQSLVKICQKISDILYEDLCTLMLLAALRNILQLEDSAKGCHGNAELFSVVNSYMLVNNTNGWNIFVSRTIMAIANMPHCYVMRTLPVLFRVRFEVLMVTTMKTADSWYATNVARLIDTRWFKYDRDCFVCKQAALRSSCATLKE